MKKAIVIGCPGSGKTTFAQRLAQHSKIPLFHLDAIWHKADRTHISREEFDARLRDILALDSWIIDGDYSRTIERRVDACDTVFLFDLPTQDCLFGVIDRLGKQRPDMPWCDTELDPNLEREVREYAEKRLPEVYALLEKYKDKKIVIFKRREDADAFLNDKMHILQTKRVILRKWNENDAEDLFKYASDPEVGPRAGWRAHSSVEESRKIIRTVLSAPEVYALCQRESGEVIGSIGLHRNDLAEGEDEYELGYWIGKPFWGQGLVPEAARELLRYAFEQLGMQRIWCGHYEGNARSRRVMEKLGFVYHHTTEGIELEDLGEIRTGHALLLTREQWESNEHRQRSIHERWAQDSITIL